MNNLTDRVLWPIRPLAALGILATLPFVWSTCDEKPYTGLQLMARAPEMGGLFAATLLVGVLALFIAVRLGRGPQASGPVMSLHLLGVFAAGAANFASRMLMHGDAQPAGKIALGLLGVFLVDALARTLIAARAHGSWGPRLRMHWPLTGLTALAIVVAAGWSTVDSSGPDVLSYGGDLLFHFVFAAVLMLPWLAGIGVFVVTPRSRNVTAYAGLGAAALWLVALDPSGEVSLGLAGLTLAAGLFSPRRLGTIS